VSKENEIVLECADGYTISMHLDVDGDIILQGIGPDGWVTPYCWSTVSRVHKAIRKIKLKIDKRTHDIEKFNEISNELVAISEIERLIPTIIT